MATGVLGKGTQIKRSTTVGGTYTAIESVGAITGPNATADQIDISDQDSNSKIRKWITGLVNPGTVSFSANFDPTDNTVTNSHNQLCNDCTDGTDLFWKLVFPGGSDEMAFPGVVTKAEISAPVDGALMIDCEITITGAITWPT